MLEKIAFPVMLVAAVGTIWVLFRQRGAAPAAAPSDTMSAALPVAASTGGGVPVTVAPYAYLMPTRFSPPASSPIGPPSTLTYPADLSQAQAVGTAPAAGASTGCGCGC